MLRLVPLLVVAAAACAGQTAPTVTSIPPVLTVAPASTMPPETVPPPADRCFADGPPAEAFVEAGVVGTAGGPGGDARRLAEIRVDGATPPGQTPACERLVADLATAEGAPATTVGVVEVELLTQPGVLRLRFPPSVSATAVADTLLPGELVGRAFVVADEAGLTVDVHLAADVAAAVVPARNRVVVDLLRRGDRTAPAATAGRDAVVISPVDPVATYPLRVTGYARSATGEVIVEISGADGRVEATAAVPDYPWGWYEVIFLDGPGGDAEIAVGDLRVPVLLG